MGNCDKVTYGYDALGRLISSESTDGYDTSYAYDLNSSPTAIVRNGLTSDGFSIGVVDDLELRYDGNRLKKVIDLADAVNIESSLDFVESSDETGDLYDESGRLTAWPGLEGSSIKYAPNDMPVFINSNKGTVGFRYRADGKKLSTATTGISFIPAIKPDTYTQYDIGSFRFYSSRRNPQMVLERINLPWGYFDASAQANVYIKDYQDNIRAVYNQDDDCIVQQTDYYPYGLPKATSTRAEANPFKYGGKELNTHLPQPFYDFVARMQLPQLCLFQRPDPKASDYTWLNPFTYCAADPINYVDPDGMKRYFVDMTGRIVTLESLHPSEQDKYKNDIDEDQIVIVGNDGTVVSVSETYALGTIENVIYNTTINKEKESVPFISLKVRNDKAASSIFEFLADNITGINNIEYSIFSLGEVGERGLNYITTSHSFARESGGIFLYDSQFKYGYTVRSFYHAHKDSLDPGRDDKKMKEMMLKIHKQSNPNSPAIIFGIYLANSQYEKEQYKNF